MPVPREQRRVCSLLSSQEVGLRGQQQELDRLRKGQQEVDRLRKVQRKVPQVQGKTRKVLGDTSTSEVSCTDQTCKK